MTNHEGFDWLGVTENGQVLGGEKHLDAARAAKLTADVAEALQRDTEGGLSWNGAACLSRRATVVDAGRHR
jgi:hypothetical protein